MKEFFNKYIDDCNEKMALKMIHKKLHKIIKQYEKGKDCKKEFALFYQMVKDFAEVADIDLS